MPNKTITSIYRKGDVLKDNQQDGIWLDYIDHTWVIYIKDRVWQKEEINRLEHGEATLSFIQKGILDAFVVEVEDCLEPSDIPFSIKDGDETLVQALNDSYDRYEIVFLDEDDKVCAARRSEIQKENVKLLHDTLKKQLSESFTSDDVDHAYEKLLSRYEPYEFLQFALFTQKDKR